VSLGSNGIIHPYLYEWFLPFRGLRVPARFAMLVGLALAVLAGFGAARLVGLLQRRRWKILLVVVLCGVILAEPRPKFDAMPLPRVPPVYNWFQGRPTAAIVEVPAWYPISATYLYYSTFHWQRIMNGSSGSIPASYRSFHAAMKEFPDESAISVLRSSGVSYAVIHEEFYGTAAYHEMLERISRSSSLVLMHAASDGLSEARIYRVLR
jgi:hypothetical protein